MADENDLQRALNGDKNLRNAVLRKANLGNANLSNADQSVADLERAFYNHTTTWPAGFDPEAAGALKVDE